MAQQTLNLHTPGRPDLSARRATEDRMREIGIRPPTRYEVLPEDLAPPVKTRSAFAAFFARVTRGVGR